MQPRTVNTSSIILATFTVFFVTASFGAGFTARAGLEQAQQTIKTWQADAALSRVGTTVLKADGTAIMWQYSFVSPATTTCARVILLAGGEPRIQDLGSCKPPNTVSTEFVDSPVMLKAAVEAGFKPGEDSDAYLVFIHDAATPDRECWVVSTIADFDTEHAYMQGWCVDPKTGQFVVRLSGHS